MCWTCAVKFELAYLALKEGNRARTWATKDSLMRDVTIVLFPTPSARPISHQYVQMDNSYAPSPTRRMRTSLRISLVLGRFSGRQGQERVLGRLWDSWKQLKSASLPANTYGKARAALVLVSSSQVTVLRVLH